MSWNTYGLTTAFIDGGSVAIACREYRTEAAARVALDEAIAAGVLSAEVSDPDDVIVIGYERDE
jgi:hypothetical protein